MQARRNRLFWLTYRQSFVTFPWSSIIGGAIGDIRQCAASFPVCSGGGNMTQTPKVIDIFHEDDVTSFAALVDAGIQGILHKATQGLTVTDPLYAERKEEVARLGPTPWWGAYHWYVGTDDPKAQAAYFLSVAGQCSVYAIDYEDTESDITISGMIEFIEAVEAEIDSKVVIYGNHDQLGTQLASASADQIGFLAARRLWWAEYETETPRYLPTDVWPTYWLWQYTESGNISGVSGACDLNASGEQGASV
jgi:lysozyme